MTRGSHLRSRLAVVVAAAGLLTAAVASPASAATVVSQSTSQAVNATLGSTSIIQLSNPPIAASSDGSAGEANVVNTALPIISLLPTSVPGLSAGAAEEVAQAGNATSGVTTNGESYACSGVGQPAGQIDVGDNANSCTSSGNGGGGITLDLGQLAGSALSGLVDVSLHLDAITAFAQDCTSVLTTPTSACTALGSSATAGISSGSLTVSLLGVTLTEPLTLSAAPNTNLLTEVVTGLQLLGNNNPLSFLAPLVNSISNALLGVVALITNCQPAPNAAPPAGNPNGSATCGAPGVSNTDPNPADVISATGLHVGILGSGVTVDLAHVTVGGNTTTGAAAPAFPVAGLPIAGGVILLAALIITPWYRRRSHTFSD